MIWKSIKLDNKHLLYSKIRVITKDGLEIIGICIARNKDVIAIQRSGDHPAHWDRIPVSKIRSIFRLEPDLPENDE